jgi:hypothetical protein
VLGEACRQLSAWREQSPEFAATTVAVNVSAPHLTSPNLIGDVTEAVERAAQAAAALALVDVGPEQGGQRLAAVGTVADRDVDEQGQRPAQVQLDGPAVALEAGRAEDEQL